MRFFILALVAAAAPFAWAADREWAVSNLTANDDGMSTPRSPGVDPVPCAAPYGIKAKCSAAASWQEAPDSGSGTGTARLDLSCGSDDPGVDYAPGHDLEDMRRAEWSQCNSALQLQINGSLTICGRSSLTHSVSC